MFKTGDDLKQDNLVLQFFKMMERYWRKANQDYSMVCYDAMETAFETGYIGFVDKAVCITDMHAASGTFGPFRETSIMDYFVNTIAKEDFISQEPKDEEELKTKLKDYHEHYCKSLAGQAVATYVLGIGDRHPGNYMLQKETGKFFHIDFGHWLNHPKHFFNGMIKRDREPFIFSKEMQYFMNHFEQLTVVEDKLGEKTLIREEPWSKYKK